MDHNSVDFVRDVLSAIVAGLFLLSVSAYIAHRRLTKQRLEEHDERLSRHAVEIRHTQKEANIDPFYKDSENDL